MVYCVRQAHQKADIIAPDSTGFSNPRKPEKFLRIMFDGSGINVHLARVSTKNFSN
jgi:hypothetical protein